MELQQGQLDAMRKDADQRIINETLQSLSVDEMRRVLIFLQQSLSARGRGTVHGQLEPYNAPPKPPVDPVAQSPKPRGFAWRRAPKRQAPEVVAHFSDDAEVSDGLDARRLALYRQLGRLGASGLDEIQAAVDRLNADTAAKDNGGKNA